MQDENKMEILGEENKPAEKDEKQKPTGWKRVVKEVREWVVSLIVAVIAVLIIKEFLFMPILVDGSSMYPTLNDGERLAVTVYDVKIADKVQKGDVVICNYPGRTNKDPILHLFTMDTNFVKRVVGVPGDTVSRVSGVTYINGEALDPSSANSYFSGKLLEVIENTDENGKTEKTYRVEYRGAERILTQQQVSSLSLDYEYVLGEEEYFVVGDNRYNSHDCRAWNGPDVELNLENNARGDVGPITKDMIVGRAKFTFWPLNAWRSIPADTNYVDPRDR